MANKIARFLGTGVIFTLVLLSGCSGDSSGNDSNEVEAAKIEGRIAARKILTRSWHDTLELRMNLEKSRAMRGRYDSIGHKHAAESFDSAFVSTIRTVNPGILKVLEKQ